MSKHVFVACVVAASSLNASFFSELFIQLRAIWGKGRILVVGSKNEKKQHESESFLHNFNKQIGSSMDDCGTLSLLVEALVK